MKETLSPAEIMHVYNNFYAIVVESVHAYNGIVDKSFGDSISASFGLAVTSPKDAEHAIFASLQLKQAVSELNVKFEIEGLPRIQFAVGISTGEYLTGIIGGGTQYEYSVVGDAMNVSQRFHELAKCYGSQILICEETRQVVKDLFHIREIDLVSVKNKTEPLVLFEIIGSAENDMAHDLMTVTFRIFYHRR